MIQIASHEVLPRPGDISLHELAQFTEAELPNILYSISLTDIELFQQWVKSLKIHQRSDGSLNDDGPELSDTELQTPYPDADMYHAALQRYGVLKKRGSDWILDTDTLDDRDIQHHIIQSFIVEKARADPMAARSVAEIADGIELFIRLLQDQQSLFIAAGAETNPNTLLSVARQLKIFSFEKFAHHTLRVQPDTPDEQVVNNRLHLEFLIFIIQFFHHSTDDTSHAGWDSAIAPETVIDTILEKSTLTKAMLVDAGILKARGKNYRCTINGSRFEIREHMDQIVQELTESATTIPELPSDLKLVDPATIQMVLNKYPITLEQLVSTGILVRAYSRTTTLRLKPHCRYYVGGSQNAIQTWQASAAHQDWMEQDTLKTILIGRFIQSLRDDGLLTDQADYAIQAVKESNAEFAEVPVEAYLIPDNVITDSKNNVVDIRELSKLGYVVPAEKQITKTGGRNRSRYFVIFPNPNHGKLFKRNSAKQFETDHRLCDFRVQQILASSKWQAIPWRSDVPAEYGPVKALTYNQLRELTDAYPPLTTARLCRLGYACYGQQSNPEPTMGIYLFSTQRKAQSMIGSTWHATLLAGATQRGYDNLKLRQPTKTADV